MITQLDGQKYSKFEFAKHITRHMANLLPMGVCDRNLHTKKAKGTLSKAFLEHVVVDLVYKFDEKPMTSV